MNNDIKSAAEHRLALDGRRKMTVHGVNDVIDYDEGAITLDTVGGNMGIEGEGLKITSLSTDNHILTLEGLVNGIYYYGSEEKGKKGGLSRLFK